MNVLLLKAVPRTGLIRVITEKCHLHRVSSFISICFCGTVSATFRYALVLLRSHPASSVALPYRSKSAHCLTGQHGLILK